MPPNDPSPTAVTQPAPTVVTSQPAENAIGDAQNNINQYNTNAANVTPPATPPPTSTPTSNGGTGTGNTANPSGTGTPQVTPPSATTPTYGEVQNSDGTLSYYQQTGTDSAGNPIWATTPTDPAIALNSEIGAVQIPSPTLASGYNDPYAPSANVDANGNILNSGVPAAIALGTTEDVNSINARLNSTNDAITASGASSVADFQSMLNGTISLTPAQTSLISNMQTQMASLISLQQTANASYIGSITEAQARNGNQSSAPANAVSMVAMATRNANIALSTIASTQATAIANAENAAQQQNYTDMLSANSQYQDTLKQQQSVLENLSSQIQQSIVDARNFNEQVTQNTFQNNMASANLTLQQKQYLFNNYISTQNLSLAQLTQAQNYKYQQEQIGIGQITAAATEEQANVAQETYEATFGGLNTLADPFGTNTVANGGNKNPPVPLNADGSTPENTTQYSYNPSTGKWLDGNGNPITGPALAQLTKVLNATGVLTFPDGVAYLDPTHFVNQSVATGAQSDMSPRGIQSLDSNDASAINNAEAAKAELSKMVTYWEGTQPASSLSGEASAEVAKIGSNINPSTNSIAANQAGYASSQTALYAMLSSLSQSKRANGGEYEVGQGATPTANNVFGFNTLGATGMAGFQAIEGNLNSLIQSVIPGVVPIPDPVLANSDDVLSVGAANGDTTAATFSAQSPANANSIPF